MGTVTHNTPDCTHCPGQVVPGYRGPWTPGWLP